MASARACRKDDMPTDIVDRVVFFPYCPGFLRTPTHIHSLSPQMPGYASYLTLVA